MKTPANSLKSVVGSNVFGVAIWLAALFVLAALAIAVFLMWKTSDALVQHVVASLEHEASTIALDYRSHGLGRVTETITNKSQLAGPALYHLESSNGERIAGNLQALPSGLQTDKQGGVFSYTPRRPSDASSTKTNLKRTGVALRVSLGEDAVVYVGRDIEDIGDFSTQLRWYLVLAFSALTLATVAAGYAISSGLLRRLSRVNATAQSIMAGDLSGRIPLSGRNDELDDLSRNLNDMLDRINQLMLGLREVSDNIAHDLKTPLNRLRNRAEGALRDPRGGEGYRDGLQQIIEEADGLIRTFNALLLIARLEAGSIEKTAVTFDLSEILDDVSELYQPVAEESGLKIETKSPGPVSIHANQQLVVQALANLIDNAIKYGSRTHGANRTSDIVTAEVQTGKDTVDIIVGDRGPGIPSADRERALKRFVRLQQSRTQPGTGLGLSLVVAVARMHGGTVELTDNDPGLKVIIRLPRLQQSP